jgi:hypothetical protein
MHRAHRDGNRTIAQAIVTPVTAQQSPFVQARTSEAESMPEALAQATDGELTDCHDPLFGVHHGT